MEATNTWDGRGYRTEIAPYKTSDLAEAPLRDWDLEAEDDRTREQREAGPAWTMWEIETIGGEEFRRPLGAAGVVIFRRGLGEAWIAPTVWVDESYRAQLAAAGLIRRLLETIQSEYHLRRLQTVTDCRNVRTLRLILRLGFVVEGTLEAFGPQGEPYVILARVR